MSIIVNSGSQQVVVATSSTVGLPTGGTAGQVLAKGSSTAFDAFWQTLGALAYLSQVSTTQIINEAVTTGKLAPVLTGIGQKIPSAEITTRHYETGSITTPKLADKLITRDKYADASIPATAFEANAIGETVAKWNANKLQGVALAAINPANGQTLRFNGTAWVPVTDITVATIIVVEAVADLASITSPVTGQGAFVAEDDDLYVWDGTEWELLIEGYLGDAISSLGTAVAELQAFQATTTPKVADLLPVTVASLDDPTKCGYGFVVEGQGGELALGVRDDGVTHIESQTKVNLENEVELTQQDLNNIALLVKDKDGQVLLQTEDSGETYAHALNVAGQVTIDEQPNTNFEVIFEDGLGQIFAYLGKALNLGIGDFEILLGQTDFELLIQDEIGQCLIYKRAGEQLVIEGIIAEVEQPTLATYLTMLPNAAVESRYMSVPSYGQSLTRGNGSKPALSTTQPFDNKTLTGGVRTGEGQAERSANFIPLVENDVADGSNGETPASGMCNYLVELLGGSNYPNSFVSFASGAGGRPINGATGLDKPSNSRWPALQSDLILAHQASTNLGATHSVPFMAWTQGEQNINIKTDRRLYLRYLLAMLNDFAELVQGITGQVFKPAIVMYQCCAHRRYLGADSEESYMDITLAHLDATRVSNEIVVALPAYCVEYSADNLHLSNEGSRMLGYYYGLAAKRAVFDKNQNTCLQPKRVFRRNSTTVDVVYDLVHSPIRINTAWVASAPNSGYDIRTSNNVLRNIITNVEVISEDTVRITTSAPVTVGDKVVYGWGRAGDARHVNKTTGPRGNICDSQGDVYQYAGADAVTRRLDNYAVVSENII